MQRFLVGRQNTSHPHDYPSSGILKQVCDLGGADGIALTPNHGELQIELKGNLAAMLGAAKNAKRSPETGDLSLQVVLVAGARNQRYFGVLLDCSLTR